MSTVERGESMTRIKPSAPDATPELEDTLQHFTKQLGYVPNNILILSRIPRIAKAMAQATTALWHPDSEVDRGLKRLVAYMASRTHGSKYSMAHAAESAHRAGVDTAKLEAIDEYHTSPLYTEAERVTLDFAIAAASQPNAVTNALFDKMKQHWTETQIVEITAVVAMNGFLNRWNDTVGAEIEPAPLEFATKHLPRHF